MRGRDCWKAATRQATPFPGGAASGRRPPAFIKHHSASRGAGGSSCARFLIDECLSVELAGLVRTRRNQASHLRDLGLLRSKDGQLAPIIFDGDWCFVTRNARDCRGPDDAKGSSGEYAGVDIHAGLVCIHGLPEGFARADQIEAFAVALDQIDQLGGDTTNLLVEVVWAVDGISYDIAEFPPA